MKEITKKTLVTTVTKNFAKIELIVTFFKHLTWFNLNC